MNPDYPFPKWHPYYSWGWGGQGYSTNPAQLRTNPAQLRTIGDPGLRPPGQWFGQPTVAGQRRSWIQTAHVAGAPLAMVGADPGDGRTIALTALGALIFGGIGAGLGFLAARTAAGALIGGALGIATPYVLEGMS